MQLRVVLNNIEGLQFIAGLMQHYGLTMTEQWASAALAKAQNPFVDIALRDLRTDQVELRPQSWRERVALIKRALS